MKLAKSTVEYWCDDIVKRRCLGQGITAAVLDTGE